MSHPPATDPTSTKPGYRPADILRTPTPAGWLPVALSDLATLLVDHAACEQKAAAAALSLLGRMPEDRVAVEVLSNLVQEEMRHFDLVHKVILGRGGKLRAMAANPYVNGMTAAARKGPDWLVDRLLIAALIEARSHERFELLAGSVTEPAVRELYEALIPPEEGHAALFVALAERRAPAAAVRVRLTQLADLEAKLVLEQPPEPRIHG